MAAGQGTVASELEAQAPGFDTGEPGGACALAALVNGAYRPSPGERVAVVVCGGNTDPSDL